MAPLQLSEFPEELLERILTLCAIAGTAQPARPSWHVTSRSPTSPRGRLALLLVSKTFLRICTPLYYHTLCINSLDQLQRLLTTALHPSPFLASHVRRVILGGIWGEAGELLRLCAPRLKTLDLTLDVSQVNGVVRDLDAEEFCDALGELLALNHLVIRKPSHVYLTHCKPRYILHEVAKAMQTWDQLEHADVAFRLSDDSGAKSSLAVSPQPGPMSVLTESLSTRPKLRTFSTILPSVWNEAILRVSVNPSLERIILADVYAASGPSSRVQVPAQEVYHGVASTSLFMLGVKKHPRLSELIRAGTSIVRMRAQTLGSPSAPQGYYSASPASPYGASALGPQRRSMPSYQSVTNVGASSSPSAPSTTTGGIKGTPSESVSSKEPVSAAACDEKGVTSPSFSASAAAAPSCPSVN